MIMAASLLSTALKEQLSCSICLSVFTEPKTLKCLHSFCLPCLKELALKTPPNIPLRCPDCQDNIVLPPDATFDALPNSFYFNRLLELLSIQESQQVSVCCGSCERNLSLTSFCFECGHFLCSECTNAHKLLGKVLKGHRCVALEKFKESDMRDFLERPESCSIEYHDQEKLEYFCEDCKTCICQKCVLLEHKLHQFEPIKKAVDKCKGAIAEVVTKVKEKVSLVQEAIREAEETFSIQQEEIKTATNQVDQQVEHLIQLLNDHRTEMISELEEIEKKEKLLHEENKCRLEGHLAQLKSGLGFADAAIERDLTSEIINTHKSIVKRCTSLEVASVKDNSRERNKIQYITDCVTAAQVTPGCVVVTGPTDPARSTVVGEELREAEVCVPAEFVVETRNTHGHTSHLESDSISVTIAGEAVESTVKNRCSPGLYTVQYTPMNVGSCEIAVQIAGQAPTGSPFEVRVKEREFKPLKTFGSEGSGAEQLECPWGIAVNSSGEVAVADKKNSRIQLFSSDGRWLKVIGSKGTAKGELSGPKGIAFDQHDRIVVADSGNGRIQIFTAAGRCSVSFGEDELVNPHGVCATNDGKIAVCSGGDFAGVKKFTLRGMIVSRFNDSTRKSRPICVSFGGDKFFVSYPYDHGVSVFTKDGTLLYSFGEHGQGDGQFDRPHGVVFHMHKILVCDLMNHRIQVFKPKGQFLQKTGTEGVDLGQLREPLGLASAPNGQLYVSEWSGHRVQVFQYQLDSE